MSENPKKFPLLCLPSIAAEHVIRTMKLRDMFILSLISTRAKYLLNYSLPKNHAHIKCSLVGREHFDIQFFPGLTNVIRFIHEKEQDHVAQAGGYNSYKLHDIQCKFFFPRGVPMKILSEKPFEIAARGFIAHLAESYHSPKISIDFGRVVTPGAALALLNCVKALHLPMEKIMLGTTNTPEEVYRAFLDAGSKISQQLFLRSEVTPDFQYSPSETFKLDLFHIGDGDWVHVQDYMECRSIVVDNKTANSIMYSSNAQRLNEFFKVWQRSSCRLERLQICVSHSQELNFEELTMGLNGTNFTRNDEFQSVDIEREDGRKAVIQLTQFFLTLRKRN